MNKLDAIKKAWNLIVNNNGTEAIKMVIEAGIAKNEKQAMELVRWLNSQAVEPTDDFTPWLSE